MDGWYFEWNFNRGNHAGKVKDPFDDFSGPQNIGHLFITFKTTLFQKHYNQRIKDNIKTIKQLPKIKGVKEIMYPGQNKFYRYKKNLKKKISINKKILDDISYLLQKWFLINFNFHNLVSAIFI